MKRSRNFAVTLNYRFYSLEEFIETLDVISNMHAEIRGYTIGAYEEGDENGYSHSHVLVVFKHPQRDQDVANMFPKLHVECVRSYKEYRKYMKKDGPFLVDTLATYNANDDLLEDMDHCETFAEFMRLHPELVSQIRNWERMWYLLGESIKDGDNNE